MKRIQWRFQEALLLLIVYLIAWVGFYTVSAARLYRNGMEPVSAASAIILPVLTVILVFTSLHMLLSVKKVQIEQMILPVTALLTVLGMIMIWRLRGGEGILQQVTRGLIPGFLISALFIFRPSLLENARRRAYWIGLAGLFLLFLTGFLGVEDETGSKLALRIGSFAIQTSEIIKFSLIIFLAWYIEREGRAAEGRAHTLLWFRLPAIRYLAPAAAFVGAATLALVAMSDFGAVIILGLLFITMLFIGFETRIFMTIVALGLGLSILVGLLLSQIWTIPSTIQFRYLAFLNPWSSQILPNGLSISEGPGYQIQQSIYAIIAGGVTGSGLGMGSPGFIPLAHSDFILAALFEEMGSAVGIAILALYALLILRIYRLIMLVPREQVFERLLLSGIGVHFFTQLFVMAGGTFNLIPLTGVTLPFLSLGGISLLVNMVEIGMVLTLTQRLPAGEMEKI